VIGSLSGLKDLWRSKLAVMLITSMIDPAIDPHKRPSCKDVLKHPLFWEKYQVFDFLQTCFTFMKNVDETLRRELEEKLEKTVGDKAESIEGDWFLKIKPEINSIEDGYESTSVMSLLTFINENVSRARHGNV
jgi:serine/threonine protein kinase